MVREKSFSLGPVEGVWWKLYEFIREKK